jgi:hypothetical protein
MLRLFDFYVMQRSGYLPANEVYFMKNAIFLDETPRGSCENRRFRGTCRFHLQGRKIREQGIALAVG